MYSVVFGKHLTHELQLWIFGDLEGLQSQVSIVIALLFCMWVMVPCSMQIVVGKFELVCRPPSTTEIPVVYQLTDEY